MMLAAFVSLPQQAFLDDIPEFPTFRQYADYLMRYADNLNVSYNSTVTEAAFADNLWHVNYQCQGSPHSIVCTHLVIASGRYSDLKRSNIPGLDQSFGKPILLADDILDISAWKGKHIFIVGMGNTGMDVCMALLEAGAKVTFGLRRVPTIASVNILGIGIHSFTKSKRR